jgi:hypothetical protein
LALEVVLKQVLYCKKPIKAGQVRGKISCAIFNLFFNFALARTG